MQKINKLKLILSKIKIAQFNSKQMLTLELFSNELFLLNILWKNGFIYGYNIKKNKCFIFLKYDSKGQGLIKSIDFINKKVSKKEIQNLLKLDPYKGYFIFTNMGIKFYSLKNSYVLTGGKLFLKV